MVLKGAAHGGAFGSSWYGTPSVCGPAVVVIGVALFNLHLGKEMNQSLANLADLESLGEEMQKLKI